MKKISKCGLLFSFIHLLLFVVYVSYVSSVSERDGQAQLLWIVWLLTDFPISLLLFVAKELGLSSFNVFYAVHGLLGTIWWYFVPTMIFWKGRKD